jgi:hypothetical protein
MTENENLENTIIQDLADKDILQTIDDSQMLLKPKGKNNKPKHTRVISEETKQQRREHLQNLNKKRTEQTLLSKEEDIQKKEADMKAKLDALEVKKKQLEEIKAKHSSSQKKPKEEPKPVEKRSKKQVKIVVEQSSSDSEDYGSSSSSEEEVVYIAKTKKQPKKLSDEKPITKPKEETSKSIQAPSCVFKFV